MTDSDDPTDSLNPYPSDASERVKESPATEVRPRIWPLVVLAAIALWGLFGPTLLGLPDFIRFGSLALGAVAQVLLLVLWGLFASRIPWRQRWMLLLLGIGTLVVAFALQNQQLGISILLFGVPVAVLVLTAAALLSGRIPWPQRRWILLAAWALPILAWLALRSDGFMASFAPQLRWRWSPTTESLVAKEWETRRNSTGSSRPVPVSVVPKPGDWMRFRGNNNDGQSIETSLDLSRAVTPNERWKRAAGPSWASLIVVGGFLYTMEQRGEEECIVCMDAETGEEIWTHAYPSRFVDPTQVSGVGPRGTPIFSNGILYAVGAEGKIHALRANDGSVVWQRDLIEDTGGKVPQWGMSTTPMVEGDRCVIMSSSESGDGVDCVCYAAATGEILWKGSESGSTYSSPKLATLSGVPQVLIFSTMMGNGRMGQQVVSRDLETGRQLWRYDSQGMGNAMVTPMVIDGSTIVSFDGSRGAIALRVQKSSTEPSQEQGAEPGWSVEPAWTQNRLLAEFCDGVIQDGMLLGLSKGMLTALDVESGKLLWKKYRFGGGQVIGIEAQDAVLAVSETGVLHLIRVTREGPETLQEWQGLEGKTWNHPVVVGSRVYCRNAEQIACYELAAQ